MLCMLIMSLTISLPHIYSRRVINIFIFFLKLQLCILLFFVRFSKFGLLHCMKLVQKIWQYIFLILVVPYLGVTGSRVALLRGVGVTLAERSVYPILPCP